MAKPKKERFITEIPLKVTPRQRKMLNSRFEAARQVYNACLGEAIRRWEAMRESEDYQAALYMPKGRGRTKTFYKVEHTFGLTEYDMQSYTKQFNQAWMRKHLDSQVNRQLALRALRAVNRWRFGTDKPCKRKGQCPKTRKRRMAKSANPERFCSDRCTRPRFRRYGELNAVEGKSNLQSIRWREDRVVWASSTRDVLDLEAVIDQASPVMMHGLQSPIKYVRLVRRVIRGKDRFYAQLICEGKPCQRIEKGEGDVGLDVGPSTIAIVSEHGEALLMEFVPELDRREREIRQLQRKRDRQQRANNPENYHSDGRIRKGPKTWRKSKRQQQTERKLADIKRKQKAHRKSLHGQLVNRILTASDTVKTEKLSYKSLQKNFGRSVQHKAPGTFLAMLRRRADALGYVVMEFPTWHTRFSQLCHKCGSLQGKTINDREHECDCGVTAQRDLYSAFLALCYDTEDERLDVERARDLWEGNGIGVQAFRLILDEAEEVYGKVRPSSFGRVRKRNNEHA